MNNSVISGQGVGFLIPITMFPLTQAQGSKQHSLLPKRESSQRKPSSPPSPSFYPSPWHYLSPFLFLPFEKTVAYST